MIFYLGDKITDKVDEKVRLGKNKLKSWEYGYDQEHDIIIISKDGTLGTVFFVNGIYIGLPEPPSDRKGIINWDKTTKGQKWKREELPKGLNSKTQFDPKYEEFIERQINLRLYGSFILIKGELVYMTGSSHFFYQWSKLDEGYPAFRIIQNELLIYWEACKADPRCYGIDYVKNRRFGWTSLCNSEGINLGTSNENKEIGIISKTGKDSRKNFGKLVRTFKKLPAFFKPSWDGSTTPKKELVLTEPTRKKKLGDDEDDFEEGLDTTIEWHNTVLNSMDGDKIFLSLIDEGGKFPKECPFDQYWRIVKTSHRQGKRIVGKSMVGSTVNSKKKGGREFETVFMQSDPRVRSKNGQTASGLYNLFISAAFGLEGFYDIYGFSIIDDPEKPVLNDLGEWITVGANTHLDNELEALREDPDAYNEQLRQFPRTVKEAFRDESEDCEFNLPKILEQIDYNKEELEEKFTGNDPITNNDIERGNFTWENGVQDTKVIWNPDPLNGRFWIRKGCHPPLEFRNIKEKKFKHGVTAWAPKGEHLGCFGVDPYNRDKSADGRGSKGAIHLSTTYNTSTLPNDAFILEYIDRAKKVTIFFEEVLMAMVYYSIPMLGELSNEAFLQYIADRGYRHYSLNNPFKSYNDLNPTEKKLGGAPPQNSKIADQQFYAIESYIEDHIGVARDERNRPKGTIGDMPFTRTLEQWKDVDLKDRTKYDAFISSSLSRLGCQRRIKKPDEKKKPRKIPFKKYDNSGNISQAV
ncbi:hypothetical protein SAMN04489761_4293 [Tenacibaculum sp. MAR_2009_124]|uniref:hypothetical protein n=1 Tax=Tenacibaculum sp. MAR_2009_124 TaxID=1250059 RepID=UPI0008991FE7|nr:hypothetical protein [Tenacibaculum sp. MAR_2009_124]SED10612.1 hypothetical protein SAMN04489761_4293 [Tenacibaculum sp. MAR_2009_124]